MKVWIGRMMRFGKALAKDAEVPRWAKVLLVVGMLPLPGPLDEIAWMLAGGFLLLRHRRVVTRCWQAAA